MNTPRWERAKEIFDAALDLVPEAWASYLSQACGDDMELRREVEGLLAADSEAGSFLDPGWLAPFSPFKAEPEFELAPGDIVSGRFRIVRPLGDGGMGRVYEAHDSVLGVQVALKTLRPEISANPEVLFRFQQEVRIAHRITHPNVCRTYHLDHELRRTGAGESSAVDLTFLTMEYLNGETLQQLLRRGGRLGQARALAVARQMAEAMEAAHQIGIIHRDIKPGNVMICPESAAAEAGDRVVVTDFGLAKFEASAVGNDLSSISQPGRAMGTLAYMAPEQLQGGEVGPATDIYAFGLVLYEMVTGVKAFPDANTMAAAYRRTSEPPPSPRAIVAELPSTWETAVLGCLQIDPAARFQHAAEVIEILDGSMPHSSRLRALRRPKAGQSEGIGRRSVAIGVAVAAVVSLFAIGWRYSRVRGDAAVAPGTLVYLAPVKNETGEKQLDNVTELVRAGLEQSAHINLLGAGRVGDILQQMTKAPGTAIDAPAAREVAMRAGAARVVFASVSEARGEYKVEVDVQQPDNTPQRYRHHWAKSFAWKGEPGGSGSIPAEVLNAARDASDWIRREVGESANDIARLDVPPENVTTGDWVALQRFARAQQLLAEHEKDAAIRMLHEATQADPHFALAYAELGDNLMSEFRTEEARSAYDKAIAFEQEGRLTPRERYFIVATRAIDTADYPVALDALKSYTDLYPNDTDGWFYLSYPLIELGRPEEAVFALRKAASLGPDQGAALIASAVAEVSAGHLDAARRDVEQAKAEGATDGVPYVSGMIAFLEGRYADAEASFRLLESAKSTVYQGVGYSLLARALAERGRREDALRVLDEAVEHSKHIGDQAAVTASWMDRAYLMCRLGRYAECFSTLDLAASSKADPAQGIQESFVLGTAAAEGSAAVRAESVRRLRILAGADRGKLTDGLGRLMRLRVEGELQGALGNWRAALASFREADGLDAPVADRAYLGRALVSAARQEPDPVAAKALRSQAEAMFRRTLEQPGHLWHKPWLYAPGLLGDEMQAYLHLCATGVNNDDFCATESKRYQNLRAEQP